VVKILYKTSARMKIAIIGTGSVGQTIASRLLSLEHQVMIGTRNPGEKLSAQTKDMYGNPPFSEWYKKNTQVKVGTFAEVAAFGEIVFNATKGGSSVEALKLADAKNLSGKILVDIANPLDFSTGVAPSLIPGLSNTHSLGEEIQKVFPQLKVVKTLNTMWCGLMVNPAMINNGDHTNFICGNDVDAKGKVKALLQEFGWKATNILDLGDISGSRAVEAVLPIWLRIWGTTQKGAFNLKVVS
jgi:8-hydroxy-5-deazaflavin:NADPH oxidoreductase